MPDHKGKTNKKTEIKLESDITRIVWTAGTGCPGGKVGLEIETQFVGVNSEASIEITDKSGKKFDTIKKKIYGNKLWLEITVPEKAKDELYAEIKLSKHGVSKKSRGLYLFPFVEIKNLKWDKQEARRGDILKLSADIKGLADGNVAEIQIWEHDADDAHDLVTKFPVTIRNQKIEADWEFQYVDDTDDIPTQEESEKGYQWPEYFFRVVCAGKLADSGLLKFKDFVSIQLLDSNGDPISEMEYELRLADGSLVDGKLDNDGKLQLEVLSPGPISIVYKNLSEELEIKDLTPQENTGDSEVEENQDRALNMVEISEDIYHSVDIIPSDNDIQSKNSITFSKNGTEFKN